MRVGLCAAVVAALIFASGAAGAACKPGPSRDCINLDLVPQITQRIAGDTQAAAPSKRTNQTTVKPAYTGPIVGLTPTVRPTPTVGYRWSLD
jgi:hypothetical protein